MKSDSIVGIDLAKNVFHVCVMNGAGRVQKRKRLRRKELFEWVTNHCTGVVAFEACGGAHYWARRFRSVGFEVRMIAGQFVKPYVKSNKNDEIDAEAICEAASRPQMRLVGVRSEEQQDIQNLHRVRERLVRQRTAVSNEIRGLLLEYGIVIQQGLSYVRNELHGIVEAHRGERGELWARTFLSLHEELCEVDEKVKRYTKELKTIAKQDPICRELLNIPAIGELGATAIVAAVGDVGVFKNGRQFAASFGVTPTQHSTGGKTRLGRISKRGNRYIRCLAVLGSQSQLRCAKRRRAQGKDNSTDRWALALAARRGHNVAVVAYANKTLRRVWTVLSGEKFMQPEELSQMAA